MQLIDITFSVSEERKQYMLDKLRNIRARYSCTSTFLGVSSLCNPYVLVYGQDLNQVEDAKFDVTAMIIESMNVARSYA
jgi:hypothetical protein